MPLNLEEVSEFFRNGDYYITKHGYEELDDDGITIERLETAIGLDNPKIIEDYPSDPRGGIAALKRGHEHHFSTSF
jgi:hypothetical protein